MSLSEIKNRIKSLKASRTQEDLDEMDSHILMANYLSEIERIKQLTGLKGKDLAKKVEISHSYLSQVFKGVKPLNFLLLAKIQRVLNIKFKVDVIAKDNDICIEDDVVFLEHIERYKSRKNGFWIYKNILTPPNYQDSVEIKAQVNEGQLKSA